MVVVLPHLPSGNLGAEPRGPRPQRSVPVVGLTSWLSCCPPSCPQETQTRPLALIAFITYNGRQSAASGAGARLGGGWGEDHGTALSQTIAGKMHPLHSEGSKPGVSPSVPCPPKPTPSCSSSIPRAHSPDLQGRTRIAGGPGEPCMGHPTNNLRNKQPPPRLK